MKDAQNLFEEPKNPLDYKAVRIGLASPDKIRSWSHGEVKKPETINYRTFKPERDGLFCARIFGPTKDYECICGKYKRMKHRGITCEKCQVQVIQAKVRRDRMGHIELSTPVAHIWFLKSLPSRITALLAAERYRLSATPVKGARGAARKSSELTLKELEKVLYCESYMVTSPGDTPLTMGDILTEDDYQETIRDYGYGSFKVGSGGEVVRNQLKNIDSIQLAEFLRQASANTQSEAVRRKLAKWLKVVDAFRESGNRPEWMMLEVIPVLPPDLRPLVPLEGGRFATSDLNELYRRVINRNNRLKRLVDLNAPEIIIRNEKRMLQEAVDALFDNGRRSKGFTGPNKRPLRSLSDMLKGKHGRFRQNLLGKRVDYSGRSVIVVGPELRLHQCGLPKKMALELFKPFIFAKLEERGLVTTIKAARKSVEREQDEVWDILEQVIKEHPVLLNRAPTLHRLGIQAFEPVLIEGKAIRLHPLVCKAFNADFDGDQMAVHVPLSIEAQVEARVLMMSTNNILSPASGRPIIEPSQDVVLGCYWMTRERRARKGGIALVVNDKGVAEEKEIGFETVEAVELAYDSGRIHLQAPILFRLKGNNGHTERVRTTVGRVLFSQILPRDAKGHLLVPFSAVNKPMGKKQLNELIDICYRDAGAKETVLMADALLQIGFRHSTAAGISICLDDMRVPKVKEEMLTKTREAVREAQTQWADGVITNKERYNKVVDLWQQTSDDISKALLKVVKTDRVRDPVTGEMVEQDSFNSIWMMVDSGARGSIAQIRQLGGMRGLMANPKGGILETPITSNLREGLNVLEYFTSTHGQRKGVVDTALKTANAGYLTRRLCDVVQDTLITAKDCGTSNGVEMVTLGNGEAIIEHVADRVLGRVTADDIADENGRVIIERGTLIQEEQRALILQEGLEAVRIRSVLTCDMRWGVCAMCYGRDLARGELVNAGEAVGVIAAQSIGEPGTQLTMRTFHSGGAAQTKERSYQWPGGFFVFATGASQAVLGDAVSAALKSGIRDVKEKRLGGETIVRYHLALGRSGEEFATALKKGGGKGVRVAVVEPKLFFGAGLGGNDLMPGAGYAHIKHTETEGRFYVQCANPFEGGTGLDWWAEEIQPGVGKGSEIQVARGEDGTFALSAHNPQDVFVSPQGEVEIWTEAWPNARARLEAATPGRNVFVAQEMRKDDAEAKGEVTAQVAQHLVRAVSPGYDQGHQGLVRDVLKSASGFDPNKVVHTELGSRVDAEVVRAASEALAPARDAYAAAVKALRAGMRTASEDAVAAAVEVMRVQIGIAGETLEARIRETPTPHLAALFRGFTERAHEVSALLQLDVLADLRGSFDADAIKRVDKVFAEGTKFFERVDHAKYEVWQVLWEIDFGEDKDVAARVGTALTDAWKAKGTKTRKAPARKKTDEAPAGDLEGEALPEMYKKPIAVQTVVGPRLVVEVGERGVDNLLARRRVYVLKTGDTVSMRFQEPRKIHEGAVLYRTPSERVTDDITSGLPRVAELFEARQPKEVAILAEISGVVRIQDARDGKKGKRRLVIRDEQSGDEKEKVYLIPKGREIRVNDGQVVRKGQKLVQGAESPHDILKIKGEEELARHLVNATQEVYRLEGVRINDKHLELIVRQMLRRVRVTTPGASEFLVDEAVDRFEFEEVVAKLEAEGKEVPASEPLLLGITKASLATDSFLSAASFQETTRVLTEAAVHGRRDTLRGIKENVLMGRLIPAGTGFAAYHKLGILVPDARRALAGHDDGPDGPGVGEASA